MYELYDISISGSIEGSLLRQILPSKPYIYHSCYLTHDQKLGQIVTLP